VRIRVHRGTSAWCHETRDDDASWPALSRPHALPARPTLPSDLPSRRIWRRLALMLVLAVLTVFAASSFAQWTPEPDAGYASLKIAGKPDALALAGDARILAVAQRRTKSLRLLNPDTGATLRQVSLPRIPIAVALSPTGSKAYVLLRESPNIVVIDVAQCKPTRNFRLDSSCRFLRKPNRAPRGDQDPMFMLRPFIELCHDLDKLPGSEQPARRIEEPDCLVRQRGNRLLATPLPQANSLFFRTQKVSQLRLRQIQFLTNESELVAV